PAGRIRRRNRGARAGQPGASRRRAGGRAGLRAPRRGEGPRLLGRGPGSGTLPPRRAHLGRRRAPGPALRDSGYGDLHLRHPPQYGNLRLLLPADGAARCRGTGGGAPPPARPAPPPRLPPPSPPATPPLGPPP